MIIGISGNNGAGKDTFGMLLQAVAERDGKKVKRFAFADPLYFISSYLYGTPRKQVLDNNRELKNSLCSSGLTVRETLIRIGACIREIKPTTWVDLALEHATEEINIITDVRFDNEASICNLNITVTRDGYHDNVGKVYGEVIIHNNGNLDDLSKSAEEVYEKHVK